MSMSGAVGFRRRLIQVTRGQARDSFDCPDPWGNDIEAACAEMAFAKMYGLYWDGSVDTYKDLPDVGGYEVRRVSDPMHHLIIRKQDIGKHDDAPVVMVSGVAPHFVAIGWARPSEVAVNERAWKDAWRMAAGELHHMDELPKL